MPSILDEFEYDIFISYRHNDNKYDGWVTEFVTKLKQELEATIKDKLTVYFDENPQDGLLESHQVDQSVDPKIKSLILIPIVSQTYCDPESFAWNSEFLAFNKVASADRFGRDVKLPNGNVASRILPIKIHDIELADLKMLENELQGVLRSIDFIYHTPGVNRPLRPKDDDLMDNANQTIYRNQINKVANAIKELISGLKNFELKPSPASGIHITSAPIPQSITPSRYSTTIPSELKVTVIDSQRPTVFLAWTSNDLKAKREEMSLILQKAGFNVAPSTDCPSDDDEFKTIVEQSLKSSSCALHILSGEFGRRFEAEDDVSFPMHQFQKAKEVTSQSNSNFHTFIWFIEDPTTPAKSQQIDFINHIRNNITQNMMFTNSYSPMQLVEDMRSILIVEEAKILDITDTDIFFIFNQQDESEAQRVTDLISIDYPVETMNILPGGEEEYRELSTQQIPRSKLAVVYFRWAADWALPFIKQVWKQVGGASSPTYLLLVGEDDPKSNLARTFKAPKVVSTVVSKENVADEVKKVYSQIIEFKG